MTCSTDDSKCLKLDCVVNSTGDVIRPKLPPQTTNECVTGWVFTYTGHDPNFTPPESGCIPMIIDEDGGLFTWCCPWNPNN